MINYISKEEFSNQELGIQRIFKEYFDGESMLFWNNEQLVYWRFEDISINIPAITEGQLRKFIEDKTGCKMEIVWDGLDYDIYLVEELTGDPTPYDYLNLGKNLLQAYWKVAIEIAKEELQYV